MIVRQSAVIICKLAAFFQGRNWVGREVDPGDGSRGGIDAGCWGVCGGLKPNIDFAA